MKYEVVVGIETHVQLATKSKLFCSCNNDSRDVAPNTHVCPVCMGFPGALPVLNGAAVKLALKAGLALNAYDGVKELHTKFDRKNYFYPDSPMNYQITQFDEPIIGQGYVEFPVNGKSKRVGVTRAQLEADAGKLIHPADADYSLVDLNRAGTPLLEIVSEPDIRSAEEAKAYAQELYHLMRYANVSDANLYYGNIRFDVNVSLRPKGSTEFGTRTESKNLNSFRAVAGVVEYETKRQAQLLDKGEIIVQETRGWDENKQQTFSQRTKEEAHDYRYFPEPDLPPLVITKKMLDEAKKGMPSALPNDLRKAFNEARIPSGDSETLLGEQRFAEIVLAVIADAAFAKHAAPVAKRLVGLSEELRSHVTDDWKVTSAHLAKLEQMVGDGTISTTASKAVFERMLKQGGDPEQVAKELSLIQVSDTGALEAIVDQVLADNPGPVAQYKAGEAKVMGFLVGQVMKQSKGQANPPMVNEILKKKLGA